MPARQRLNAGNGKIVSGILRLVEGYKLPFLDAPHDFICKLLGMQRFGLQFRGIEGEAIAARALGSVERKIGIDEQLGNFGRARTGG